MTSLEDKVNAYFSSMNSMAKKIMLERENLKAIYGDQWNNLTFHRQEELIDDHFIDSTVQTKYKDKTPPSPVPQWFPKLTVPAGEKIVVDFENDGWTWQDEHSGPFSWETKSLQEFSISDLDDSKQTKKTKNKRPASSHEVKGSIEKTKEGDAPWKPEKSIWDSPFLRLDRGQDSGYPSSHGSELFQDEADDILQKFGITFSDGSNKSEEILSADSLNRSSSQASSREGDIKRNSPERSSSRASGKRYLATRNSPDRSSSRASSISPEAIIRNVVERSSSRTSGQDFMRNSPERISRNSSQRESMQRNAVSRSSSRSSNRSEAVHADSQDTFESNSLFQEFEKSFESFGKFEFDDGNVSLDRTSNTPTLISRNSSCHSSLSRNSLGRKPLSRSSSGRTSRGRSQSFNARPEQSSFSRTSPGHSSRERSLSFTRASPGRISSSSRSFSPVESSPGASDHTHLLHRSTPERSSRGHPSPVTVPRGHSPSMSPSPRAGERVALVRRSSSGRGSGRGYTRPVIPGTPQHHDHASSSQRRYSDEATLTVTINHSNIEQSQPEVSMDFDEPTNDSGSSTMKTGFDFLDNW